MRLEDRIDQIRQDISAGRYTTAAKECAGVIEFAFREIFRRSIGLVDGDARRRAFDAETKIGGSGKSLELFTLGELVRLFRESRLFEAYSEATGTQLRAITMIDFNQVVALRNRMQHDLYEASRGEAQLFLQCVENMLEAFGILTLEAAEGTKTPTLEAGRLASPPTRAKMPSSYSPHKAGEIERLAQQAALHRALDCRMFDFALEELEPPVLGLDVGCARGEVTVDRFGPYAHFNHVVGVDNDERCIQRATDTYTDQRWSFAVMDIESPQAADDIADLLHPYGVQAVVAFLAMVLNHLAAPIRVLKTLRSALPAGSRLVIRTFDDGSKMDYPDDRGRLAQIVDLTQQAPGESDRLHGRKLFHQLYRAGYRDVRLFAEPILLGNLSADERKTLNLAHFSHRVDNWERVAASGELDETGERQLAALRELLEEYELDLDDPGFFFYESLFGAVATVR